MNGDILVFPSLPVLKHWVLVSIPFGILKQKPLFLVFRQVLGLNKRKSSQELFHSIGKDLKIIIEIEIGSFVISQSGFMLNKFVKLLFLSLIENVTVEDVKRVGFRMLASKPSVAGLGNLTTLPKYQEVQHAFGNSGNFTGASRFFLFRN